MKTLCDSCFEIQETNPTGQCDRCRDSDSYEYDESYADELRERIDQ